LSAVANITTTSSKMFQDSSSSQRKTSKSSEPAPALPDWLAYLTPRKETEDDPFGLKKGIVMFPPEKKEPIVISGKLSQGNLKSIEEKEQDLLKDLSPVKPKRLPMESDTVVTKASTASDPVKAVPVSISLKWLLLVLGTWLIVSQYTKSSQPESSSPVLPPPMALPPPASEPEVTRARTTTGIPKRIFNIIKQELSPFPSPPALRKDASVESSPTTSPFSSNPTTTLPSVNITETTMRIVHELQSKTLKIVHELKRIVKELQSKITSYAKELHSKMQGIAKELQSKIESMSEPQVLSPETRQQCDHLWKWILNRSCRVERKRMQTSHHPPERMTTKGSLPSSATKRAAATTMNELPDDEASQCQNLLSRECRQQKRAVLAEAFPDTHMDGSTRQVKTTQESSSERHTPAQPAVHKPSVRDTRYSQIVLKAFSSGGKRPGRKRMQDRTTD
jgi:hypothetical protein